MHTNIFISLICKKYLKCSFNVADVLHLRTSAILSCFAEVAVVSTLCGPDDSVKIQRCQAAVSFHSLELFQR